MTDLRRRRSGTMSSSEKITGVKNAQAEKMLGRMVAQFASDLRQRDRLIQGECFKLQYDKKLMGLDRKRSDLENRRRLDPEGDHSHAERSLANIEKYCTQSSEIMPYTDKSLRFKVRTQSLPDAETPIVAQARGTLRRQDTNAALERKKAQMYNFLDKPKHHPSTRDIDETDGHPVFMAEHGNNEPGGHNPQPSADAPKFSSALKSRRPRPGAATAGPGEGQPKSVSISLPAMQRSSTDVGERPPASAQPTSRAAPRPGGVGERPGGAGERPGAAGERPGVAGERATGATSTDSTVKRLMCRNPVIKEAIEQQRPATQDGTGSRPPPEEIALRQRPLTHGAMRAARRDVQKRVNAFCARVENEVIEEKTTAFEREVSFASDRAQAYRLFTEEMKHYRRQDEYKDKERYEREEAAEEAERKRVAEARQVLLRLSAADKDRLIMDNIGRNSNRGQRLDERTGEMKPTPVPRGIPHLASERSKRHTPTAKLQRMIEALSRPVGGPPPGGAPGQMKAQPPPTRVA